MLVNIRRAIGLCVTETLCQFSSCRYFSLSFALLTTRNYRPPNRGGKLKSERKSEAPDVDLIDEDEDKTLDYLLDKSFLRRQSGHQVFVIQPYIKWGFHKKKNTTPGLQLLEAVTLIKTLRHWIVVESKTVSLHRFHGDVVFGRGVLEDLRTNIRGNPKISAVFISINTLSLYQQGNLEKEFGVPVFDRYTVIMHIFKEHAQTREAKLQLQMAQLPYLKTVLRGLNEGLGKKYGIPESFLGGEGPKLMSLRREIFKERQGQLKKEIEALREHRSLLRKNREKQEIPVVAVIGYTNAGKTSLIKALTGKKSLEPKDYLFATLDVTSHLGTLPCGLKAYFVDTLGFINDIPTYLIESFVSTLEDAVLAQVIVHVRDISHPDTVAQNDNVINTLKGLKISEKVMGNVITVGNKVDLVEEDTLKNYSNMIFVSSTEMIGIDVLRLEVQKKILELYDKSQLIIRVQTASEEYNWLQLQSTVVRETPDPENVQYMFLETIISSSNLAKFKHNFIKNSKR